MANFEEALASFVDGLDDEDLVSIWNEYCVECHLDDFIYLNNEDFFVENFSNVSASENTISTIRMWYSMVTLISKLSVLPKNKSTSLSSSNG